MSNEATERLRALLTACLDGSKHVGETRLVDPVSGKRIYLGDLAAELLDQLDRGAA